MVDGDPISAARFLAGDPEAVAVVRGWITLALSPFRFRLGAETHDLAQQALVELIEALRRRTATGEEPRDLRAFAWRLTVRSAIDRTRARRRWRFEAIEALAEPASPEIPAIDHLLHEESRAGLLVLFASLPEACRELFRELYEGLSYREMAARHAVREGTLRVRVLRCRRRALALAAGNAGARGAPEEENG